MLLEHFGYKVLSTSSVEDAKTVAGQSCPDMLLMDNSHPGFDITHVAEEVKKVCPTTLAVVLSPYYGVRPGSWGHVDRFVAQDDGPNVLIAQIAELFEQQADGKTAGLAIM
jgi:CheY-like chemotaxis protein